MRTILMPTVHLNGTSKAALLEQYEDALRAVSKALSALYNAAPNGRDYYVQGPNALRRAQEEHEDRIERVNSVRQELSALVMALSDT